MREEQVGEVCVDAGIIMIGDPCYHLHKPKQEQYPEFGRSWSEFVDKLYEETTQIGDATAVVVGGFGGDGVYPVFIRKDRHGRIVEAVVKFIREDEYREEEE